MRLLDLGRILPVALLSLLTPFCATEQNDTNSSESHFLDSCEGDAACPSSMRCLCGVCTKECDADAECAHLSSTAVCEQAASSCETAVCRAPRGSSDGGGTASCTDLTRRIQAAFDAAVAGQSKACTTSADCASTTLANACHSGCYVFANKTSIAATEAARDQAEADYCPAFEAAGCRHTQIPCPGPPLLSCQNGQCVAGAAAACDDLTGQMRDRIAAATASADKACTKDADCGTTGIDASCYHSCSSEAVSAAGIETLKAALDGIESDFCPSFQQGGCQAVIPPCVAPPPVKCDNGTCRTGI